MRRQIYLVPGFFGYSRLGGLNYFMRVTDVLKEALDRRGVEAEIIECRTQPTGSIRSRTLRLMEEIVAAGGLDADEIHLVGHSTGGLDIRLLATPGVRLRKDDVGKRIADKVRSVISIATPHFGTPLATVFTTVPGRNLLEFLASMALSSPGRLGIFLGSKLATAVAKFDDRFGLRNTALDYAVAKLLKYITNNPDDPIWSFLREVSTDQGAIIQLTPEGLDLFNAAVIDRPGVDYCSIITAAPPTGLRTIARLIAREKMPTPVVFRLLYALSARQHPAYPYPSPAE
ncbi:MAG: triacylglycerol lipase, partial [Myxococcota bacterium]